MDGRVETNRPGLAGSSQAVERAAWCMAEHTCTWHFGSIKYASSHGRSALGCHAPNTGWGVVVVGDTRPPPQSISVRAPSGQHPPAVHLQYSVLY
jgi:hypothetical protein